MTIFFPGRVLEKGGIPGTAEGIVKFYVDILTFLG
jgi:hypothetical protein